MSAYLKILIIIALTSFSLFLTNRIISKGAKKFYTHNYQKLEEIFEDSAYYDILFIGSSRTHNSVKPVIIDSITGLSSYNAGLDGTGLPEFKMIFEGYLLRHPVPKKIVLTLDADAFDNIYKFFNYNLYLQFLHNKIVDTTLSGNGYRTFPIKIFPFLALAKMDDISKRNAIVGFFDKNELVDERVQEKGYMSNGNGCIYPLLDKIYEYETYRIDQKSLSMLYSIIQECKMKKIELIITYAPEYNYRLQGYVLNFSEIIKVIDGIAAKSNLPFFRDDKLEMCKEKCFFESYGHLNNPGASVYSVILGKRLKDSLP